MKRILFIVLVAFPALCASQQRVVQFFPYTNCTTMDSVYFRSTMDTVQGLTVTVNRTFRVSADTAYADLVATDHFEGIVGNMKIFVGGTTDTWAGTAPRVTTNIGDTILVLDRPVTVADTSCTARFILLGAGTDSYVGEQVASAYLPPGTAVTKVIDSARVIVSKVATSTSTPGTTTLLTRGKYAGTNTQYSSGDMIGIPFEVSFPRSPMTYLNQVFSYDSAFQAQNFELVFVDSEFVYSADNAAFSMSYVMAKHVIGIVPVNTFYSYAAASVGMEEGLGLDFMRIAPRGTFWAFLVSRGTPTYLGLRGLKLKLVFLEM